MTYIRDTIYKDSILAERKETKEISANTEGIAGKWITLIIIVFLLLLPLVGITIIIIKK